MDYNMLQSWILPGDIITHSRINKNKQPTRRGGESHFSHFWETAGHEVSDKSDELGRWMFFPRSVEERSVPFSCLFIAPQNNTIR